MDETDQGVPGDPGDEWWDDVDGGGSRGWISPDDRLWRHPSESGAGSPGPSAPPPAAARLRLRSRPGPWIVGGATTCLVLALVATGLVVMTAGSSDGGDAGGSAPASTLTGEPTTEAGVGGMPEASAFAGMVAAARPSVVALRVGAAGGTSVGTGLVVESGGIIVTTARLVSGARAITVTESGGAVQPAGLVGVDQQSGLAVLRIADDLPAATFDNADPATDSVAVAMALRTRTQAGAPPAAKLYAGRVVSAGRAVSSQPPTDTFAVAAVAAPLSDDDIGCPLLDDQGHVSGLMAQTEQSGGTTTAVFLPAELVSNVARQLVTSDQVDHGWLGTQTSDAVQAGSTASHTATVATLATTPTDGARVDAVHPNSPAATAGLQVGDVITGVDGEAVQSTAELRSRLYAVPPGTSVDLEVLQDGTTIIKPVTLADPDSDVPGGGSSP